MLRKQRKKALSFDNAFSLFISYLINILYAAVTSVIPPVIQILARLKRLLPPHKSQQISSQLPGQAQLLLPEY